MSLTTYWVYCRLDVSVARTDDEVLQALREYADRAFKGGRCAITPEIERLILAEHHDAQELYLDVTRGRL